MECDFEGFEQLNDDNSIEIAHSLDQIKLHSLLKYFSNLYYNEESVISDANYDKIVNIYERKFGKYYSVGAPPIKEKVNLPYFLSSLNKIVQEEDVTKWVKKYKGPFVVEDKVDGITLLYESKTRDDGEREYKLYTHGDGYVADDVSYLLPYLNLPAVIEDMSIRGELAIKNEKFKKYATKGDNKSKVYKKGRSFVTGAVGRSKNFDPERIRDLCFIAFQIMNETTNPSQQIDKLKSLNFEVPAVMYAQSLTYSILQVYTKERIANAPYDVDGVVIYFDVYHELPEGGYPEHIIAFKVEGETKVVNVLKVQWTGSKGSKLKPVVIYETNFMSGGDLTKATGYNASFIVKNSIGPGAKILITRAGTVIPDIIDVISPSPTGPDLPTDKNYHWDERGTDIILDEDDDDVYANKLVHFFKTLDIKNAGFGRLKLLVENNYKTIDDILKMSKEDIASIEGFGETLSTQLYDDLHQKINGVPLVRIMNASYFFPGFGDSRLQSIVDEYPDLLDWNNFDYHSIVGAIQSIQGFDKMAHDFADNLPKFLRWINNNPSIVVQTPSIKNNLIKQDMDGMVIVFSGFRDNNLKERIHDRGGRVTGSISGKTTHLVLKDINALKGKSRDAVDRGVPMLSLRQFKEKYNLN